MILFFPKSRRKMKGKGNWKEDLSHIKGIIQTSPVPSVEWRDQNQVPDHSNHEVERLQIVKHMPNNLSRTHHPKNT